MEQEWFRMKKGDADEFKAKLSKNYPYHVDEKAFEALEDDVSTYEYSGRSDFPDFLFTPTFLVSNKFYNLFTLLAPEMQFKYIHLINKQMNEKLPSPLYWLPFQKERDALHKSSVIVMGMAKKIVLKREALEGARVVHVHLPADEIWLFSLEATECILRRSPIGIAFEKVTVIGS